MKRVYLTTLLTCVAALAVIILYTNLSNKETDEGVLKIGFIYEDDESLPYTLNFSLAQDELAENFGDSIKIYSKSNVPAEETEEPLRDLVRQGCRIIFTNSNSNAFINIAPEYPDVDFCQVSYVKGQTDNDVDNYHTFNSEIYQGRYVSGIAAGMKLKEMLDENVIGEDEALVGYVGAFPSPEVISGYTAFILGVRSIVPSALMNVRYTNTWGNFIKEKECARELIEDGCVIISHHSDTTGPALACEEENAEKPVYFVGYNQTMLDIAPASTLVSIRTDWAPYITEAVDAVMKHRDIEHYAKGRVRGNDVCAGFDHGWVEITGLNKHVAAEGTREKMDEAAEAIKKGKLEVFKGEYTGTNPDYAGDTIDLSGGYEENAESSLPTFHYILDGIVTIKE